MTKIQIDRQDARAVLNQEWTRVLEERDVGDAEYLTPTDRQEIQTVLESDEKAYRWLLVTAALAKATDPRIHYRALKKKQCDLDGAYAPRGVAKFVVSPWNMEIGDRLGASSYPLAGNPTQSYAEFKPEPNAVKPGIRNLLYELLERFQTETGKGKLDEMEILRAVLHEVAELPPQRPEFDPVLTGLPYYPVVDGIREFLADPAGGERLMAVTAGLLEVSYQGSEEEYTAGIGHANAADEPRGVVGDVWLSDSDGVCTGAEVKHTDVEVVDVQIAVDKAKESELRQYYYVAESYADPDAVRTIAQDESIDLVLVTIDELLTWLQPLSSGQRALAVNRIGEALLEMAASSGSVDAWDQIIDTMSTG